MRLCIKGDSQTAQVLRGHLGATFAVVEPHQSPDYTAIIDIDGDAIVMDSVDCALERHIYRHLREVGDVVTKTKGGVQSDTQCHLILPVDGSKPYETAIVRGFLDLLNKGDERVFSPKPESSNVDFSAMLDSKMEHYMQQLAAIMTGTAERASMEQMRREFSALNDKLESRVSDLRISANYAITDGFHAERSVLIGELSKNCNAIREQLKVELGPQVVSNPTFWQRVWAAIQGKVIVVRPQL